MRNAIRRTLAGISPLAVIGLCAGLVIDTARVAAEIPMIDAHSQTDHLVDLERVITLMDRAGVRRTILSARGRLKGRDLLDFAARHPGRITPAVRTKSLRYVENHPKYYQGLEKQLRAPGFGALAEVILWHARKGKRAPQWIVALDAPQVKAALDAALKRRWPFIAHIEFAAAGTQRSEYMGKLEALLRAHPRHPFPLIHMGQLPVGEARRLIGAHPNVYFLTSHANPVTVSKSRQPWVNLFRGERLSPEFRDLMVRHRTRFVLAFDNVFAEHWGEYYLKQAALWRRALAALPPAVAHAVAHGNAERLWKLPPVK